MSALDTQLSFELRQLRYFVILSEELHFGRAAQRLHIAQPALSQSIRRLEAALGVELLERTSRSVRLTRPGRVFQEQARAILAGVDRAVADTREAGAGTPVLRVGCLPTLPVDDVMQFVAALGESSQTPETRLTQALCVPQLVGLREGDLDLGIVYNGTSKEYEGLELELLFDGEPLVAFMHTGSRLASKERLGPADLAGETLAILPRAACRICHDQVLTLAEAGGFRFAEVREAAGGTPRDLMIMVAAGVGITLAPESFAELDSSGRVVTRRRLEPALFMPETVVAWRANGPGNLRPVVSEASQAARRLRARPPRSACPST